MTIRPLVLASLAFAAQWLPIHGQTTIDEATRRSPDYFFRESEVSSAPINRLYPEGREMFFAFYSISGGLLPDDHAIAPQAERDAVLARFRKAGVTLLGPQYELNPSLLDDAKKHDYSVIYSVGLDMKFHSGEPLQLTPDEITRQVREKVAAVAKEERIKVWYVTPEELRSWRKNETEYFHAAIKGIREGDPLHRPVFHYDPGHRTAEALEWIAKETDYLAKGAYTNYAKMKTQRAYIRWSMEQELQAYAALGKNGVPLLVPEMFEEPAPEEVTLIPTWVRHDVYLGLISGAKGVLVFSARQRPNFPSYELYLKAYLDVLEELKGVVNPGELFLYGTRRNDLTIDILSGPGEVTIEPQGAKEPVRYPSIHFADISYGKERYLFAVNSANEPVRAVIGGLSYASVEAHALFHKEAPVRVGEGEFEADFKPLEVRGWQLRRITP